MRRDYTIPWRIHFLEECAYLDIYDLSEKQWAIIKKGNRFYRRFIAEQPLSVFVQIEKAKLCDNLAFLVQS